MESIIILGVILALFMFRGTLKSFVYGTVIVDITLRLICYIKLTILTGNMYAFTNNHIPNNLTAIIDRYTNGLLNTILIWVLVGIYIIFLIYTIQVYIRKRR